MKIKTVPKGLIGHVTFRSRDQLLLLCITVPFRGGGVVEGVGWMVKKKIKTFSYIITLNLLKYKH